jgi:hypothetical protein
MAALCRTKVELASGWLKPGHGLGVRIRAAMFGDGTTIYHSQDAGAGVPPRLAKVPIPTLGPNPDRP